MADAIHICCPNCHAVNRVEASRIDEKATCGRCKKPIFGGGPVILTAENAPAQLGKNDLPVVIYFWAEWCGPCKSFGPTFEESARKLDTKIRFAKLDTEAEQSLAGQFNIRSIPTLVIMKGGREVARQSGAMPSAQFEAWLAEYVD